MSTAAPPRAFGVLSTLVVILVITASWWALALWPVNNAPEWLTLTRDVCFGTSETGLPNAGGWLVLMGQPLSMLLVLIAGWGRDLRAALQWLSQRMMGQLVLGTAAALLLATMFGVSIRVRTANAEPFSTSRTEEVARHLTRINYKPKPLSLVNQFGDTITLEQFHGRPVIVTFAFAHCTTICPLIVNDVLSARDKLTTQNPVVLVITLDPWRDTPSRLPAVARQWGLTGDAHLLSGDVETVERVLNAWRIPRVRNEKTGDVSHPSLVYVIGVDGNVAYALEGTQAVIRAAVEAL